MMVLCPLFANRFIIASVLCRLCVISMLSPWIDKSHLFNQWVHAVFPISLIITIIQVIILNTCTTTTTSTTTTTITTSQSFHFHITSVTSGAMENDGTEDILNISSMRISVIAKVIFHLTYRCAVVRKWLYGNEKSLEIDWIEWNGKTPAYIHMHAKWEV